jgi:hypothetical protein
MAQQPEAPVVLAAHDAGAANHLIAWRKAHPDLALRACMRGPALALWQQAFPGIDGALDPESALAGAATLVSGTGWATSFEHDARLLARRHGVRVVALIDHWTNYKARFERAGVTALPDEIWVTDDDALVQAAALFPGVSLVQLPNLYLAHLLREVAACAQAEPAQGNNLLYVLEPIRDAWGQDDGVEGEFRALDFFVEQLPQLGLGDGLAIRLRPHPSDPAGKYDAWIRSMDHLDIALDSARPLAASLAWAGAVVGCQTYAMVLALAAGKRVFSSVPPGVPACVLPQAGIVRLAGLAMPAGGALPARNR